MATKQSKQHASTQIATLETQINTLQMQLEDKKRKQEFYSAYNNSLHYQLAYTNSSDSEEDYISEWGRELVSIINHKPFKVFGKDTVAIKNDKKEDEHSTDKANELKKDISNDHQNDKKKQQNANKSAKKKKISNEEEKDKEKDKNKPKKTKRKKELDFSECGNDIKGALKKALLIVSYLKSQRNSTDFIHPVDPVKQMILDYNQYIKFPMDLGTVKTNLKDGKYPLNNSGYKKWIKDVRQIFKNAVDYNPPMHYVYITAVKLSNLFETLLKSAQITINPPIPVGFGRSVRWDDPLGWKRIGCEEVLAWGVKCTTVLSNKERRKLFLQKVAK